MADDNQKGNDDGAAAQMHSHSHSHSHSHGHGVCGHDHGHGLAESDPDFEEMLYNAAEEALKGMSTEEREQMIKDLEEAEKGNEPFQIDLESMSSEQNNNNNHNNNHNNDGTGAVMMDDDTPEMSDLHESLQKGLMAAMDQLAKSGGHQGQPGVNAIYNSDGFFDQEFFDDMKKKENMEEEEEEEEGDSSSEYETDTDTESKEEEEEPLHLSKILSILNTTMLLPAFALTTNNDDKFQIETVFFADENGNEIGNLVGEYEEQLSLNFNDELKLLYLEYTFVSTETEKPSIIGLLSIPPEHIKASLLTSSQEGIQSKMLIIEITLFAKLTHFGAKDVSDEGIEDANPFDVDDWTVNSVASKASKLYIYGETLVISSIALQLAVKYPHLSGLLLESQDDVAHQVDASEIDYNPPSTSGIGKGKPMAAFQQYRNQSGSELETDSESEYTTDDGEEEEEEEESVEDKANVIDEKLEIEKQFNFDPLPMTQENVIMDLFGFEKLNLGDGNPVGTGTEAEASSSFYQSVNGTGNHDDDDDAMQQILTSLAQMEMGDANGTTTASFEQDLLQGDFLDHEDEEEAENLFKSDDGDSKSLPEFIPVENLENFDWGDQEDEDDVNNNNNSNSNEKMEEVN